jgi:hypothetical protein
MTRLLNTPIIGPRTAIVDSSWIDMLAGLSPEGIRKMPPGFWARAGSHTSRLANNPPAAAKLRRLVFISSPPFAARDDPRLSAEPSCEAQLRLPE